MTHASPTPIRSLWHLVTESFTLLRQYWVLVYPVMLLLMLIMLVTPETATPSLDTRWLFFIGILLLVMVAFTAGVFHMAYHAVRNQSPLTTAEKPRPTGEDPKPTYAFQLLRHFLPGVGGNFFAFTAGALIHLLILAALIFMMILLVEREGGVPAALSRLYTDPALQQAIHAGDSDTLIKTIRALSATDVDAINHFLNLISSGLLAYGFISLLTIFWPVYVTAYDANVVTAYFKSIGRFFRDPLRLLFLGGFYLALSISINVLFTASAWLAVIRPLATIVLDIYFVLMLFVYADRHIQPFHQAGGAADGGNNDATPQADQHPSAH
ncbi:MAG: hypothetical protein AB7P76_08365 [Candidatus Melainabacteria bacterium]